MKFKLYTYSLPFRRPFKTAAQTFTHRKGLILELIKDDITALGEVAPLPGFSSESLDDVLVQLQSTKTSIAEFFHSDFTISEVREFTAQRRFYPSVQFGLLTVGVTLLAQKNHSTFDEILQSPTAIIPINAVIGTETENLLEAVQKYVSNGFNTIKIKTANNWDQQFLQLKKIHHNFPDLNIRVDANQSWSLQEARKNLDQLETIKIEYCEEPLSHPDEKSLKNLINETAVPIALDESIGKTFGINEALDIAPVLVIKPMVLGTKATSENIKTKAREKGTKLVYTSSLEGSLGRLMTAAIAGKFSSSGAAHGLNTGGMLREDFWRDDRCINRGFYQIPDADMLNGLIMKMNKSNLKSIDLS